MKWIRENKRNYIVTLVGMCFLMLIFYNSFYWKSKDIGERKILEAIIIFVGVVVVPFCAVRFSIINSWIKKKIDWILECIKYIVANWKKIVGFTGCLVIIIGLSYGISCLLDKYYYHEEYNIYRFWLITVFNIVLFCMLVLRKYFKKKPEAAFLIAALSLGILFIKMSPATVGVSWDDEIHYKRTLQLSNALNGIMYEADQKNIDEYTYRIGAHSGFDRDSKKALEIEYNSLYEKKGTVSPSFEGVTVVSFAYLPGAIGIMIGRGLRLSYTQVFMMGKLFNLLMYVMLFYFAMKKIPQAKILVAVIGLIPSLMFMASSYNYDPWLVGWTILGYAYYFSVLQQEGFAKSKDLAIAVLAITIGCFAKAIYFPLLFPLLFISKDRFRESKYAKLYKGIIILCGLILVASFILPMLGNSQALDDVRGGTDVSAVGQLKFILSNPIHYAKILIKFLCSYLAVEKMSYFQFMAYAGNGALWGIITITIFVVAFLDCGGNLRIGRMSKIMIIIGILGCMVLVPTSMYMGFTVVGAEYIEGCQFRYIFPVLFPTIYVLGNNNVYNKMSRQWFTIIPIVIMWFTCIDTINMLFVSVY